MSFALGVVEPGRQRPTVDAPALLASADPDLHAEPVTHVGERRDDPVVLDSAGLELLEADYGLGCAGRRDVAGQAGLDERPVGRVVTSEQGRGAVDGGALGEVSTRRQQREDRPLHPVGERLSGNAAVLIRGEPVLTRLDLADAAIVGPVQLTTQDLEQPVDGAEARVLVGVADRDPGSGPVPGMGL